MDATSSSRDREVAERFVEALNDRDADAAGSLVAPGAPVAVSLLSPSEALERDVTLDEQIAWLAAWDWRWDDVTCEVGARTVDPISKAFSEGDAGPGAVVEFNATARCTATARTNLGDVDDVSVTHAITLRLLDGEITYASWGAPPPRWMPSFLDFKEWAETRRSELWSQAWDDAGPILTAESAEVEGQLLDEYMNLSVGDDRASTPTSSP